MTDASLATSRSLEPRVQNIRFSPTGKGEVENAADEICERLASDFQKQSTYCFSVAHHALTELRSMAQCAVSDLGKIGVSLMWRHRSSPNFGL